jgi:hypothetical protein
MKSVAPGSFVRKARKGAHTLDTGLVVYLVVLIVDPYESVPFSPGWERCHESIPAALNQARTPKQARHRGNPKLHVHVAPPNEVSEHFGGTFVSLAMLGASPYDAKETLMGNA